MWLELVRRHGEFWQADPVSVEAGGLRKEAMRCIRRQWSLMGERRAKPASSLPKTYGLAACTRKRANQSSMGAPSHVTWPNERQFAFTIVDDTDSATIQNVKPVYDLLTDLQMRTTKTAWVFHDGSGEEQGSSCEQPEYLA